LTVPARGLADFVWLLLGFFILVTMRGSWR
jgi:hypothetical protein